MIGSESKIHCGSAVRFRAFLVFHVTAHLAYAFLMYGVVAINKQKYLHVAAAATYVACRECATLAREVLAA